MATNVVYTASFGLAPFNETEQTPLLPPSSRLLSPPIFFQFIFGEDPTAEMPPPEMPEEEAMALLTARDPWDGKSALDTAAILGRVEIVQYFIAKEVGLNDASTKGQSGSRLRETPLRKNRGIV